MRPVPTETTHRCSWWCHTIVFRARARLTILGVLFWILAGLHATAGPSPRNVLVVYGLSHHDILPPEETLESELRSRVPWPINFYVEDLDGERFEDEGYQNDLAVTLQHAYSGQKLDLIMTASYPALQFALKHRDQLFPSVPIVFFDVNFRRLEGQRMWPGVTGVVNTFDLRGTVDLAFRLHPKTDTVVTITSDAGAFNGFWLAVFRSELLRDHKDVKEADLIGFPADQLFERLAGFGQQTIVVFGMDPKESYKPSVGAYDILARVAQLLPTYCAIPTRECFSQGGIGGAYYDSEEQATLGAQLASRVLSGERPENIPILHGGPNKVFANWQALQHWHIPESALPAGSVILNRPPPFWARDRKYIIPALAIILALLLLIGLLWQRARKRKAEAVLRESEMRFRVMADAAPSLIWMCDAQGRVTYLNERRIAFTGPDKDAGYGDTWVTYVHPDDLPGMLAAISQALKTREAFSKEYRLRRSDGVYRWMFDVASPRVDGDGGFAGFIGSAIDITDQRLAHQALEKVSGQLIEAQEKERSRIARDLHDDICQRLALLSMELEQANRVRNESPGGTKDSLELIRKHCQEIAGDVQSLSHQLHSSRLELLGIVAAIRGFCREFSKKHMVNVEFTHRDVPRRLPSDVSLCLFRVAQEALHNAVKYSGTTEFKVDVSREADEIRLVVMDEGVGFDVQEAKRKGGLGLLSMQERIHLIHARLSIESAPRNGTKVIAAVPVTVEQEPSPLETVMQESNV
jgi:PAS domain S-box-containing protein